MTEEDVIRAAGLRTQVKVWQMEEDVCCSLCTALATSPRAERRVRVKPPLRANCRAEGQRTLTTPGTVAV